MTSKNTAVIDFSAFEEDVREIVGDAFVSITENPRTGEVAEIAVNEDLEESRHAGRWTEQIRTAARVRSGAECVTVKPLAWRGQVRYRVDVSRCK